VGLLSSPRRRRRLIGGTSIALVVGVVAFSLVHWSNTGTDYDIAAPRSEPVPPPPGPRPTPFTPSMRKEVLKTAAQFLQTAVVREHVEDSWELTAPSLKAGYTRETWATQDIPVAPYPVDAAKWDIDYSLEGVVGLKVALFPKKGEDVPAAVFDMQLRAFGKGDRRRWLVDSWTPASYTGVPNGPLLGGRNEPEIVYKSPLGATWIAVPLGILSLIVLIPAVVLIRGWLRDRRAVRRYEATLR
jgi:hypothetical protein